MIPLSVALALVGLAALWTVRDVALRLHRGSEAREAIEAAQRTEASVHAAVAAVDERATAWTEEANAKLAEHAKTIEAMKREHEAMKARLVMGGRQR